MHAGTSIQSEASVELDPIAEDVACSECGYNLRGLLPTANCPECNARIQATLTELAERRRTTGPPLWQSDRRWLTDLTEGMALVVLVLALMVAIAFVPDWTWPGRSRLREVLLGIACGIWVIGWFAAWKLGRPEPNERTWRAWWLRGSATLYLTFPFWWGLAPNPNPGGWLAVLLVALAAGVVAIPGYYRVLRQLAWRARSRFLPIHATLLSIFGILVFLVVVLLPDGHGSRDSLSMILGLPTMQIGSADNVRYALHMWHGSWPHPLELLILVFPVWAVAINVWMLALLVQTVRRADAATASALSGAARGGRSGSSSRP